MMTFVVKDCLRFIITKNEEMENLFNEFYYKTNLAEIFIQQFGVQEHNCILKVLKITVLRVPSIGWNLLNQVLTFIRRNLNGGTFLRRQFLMCPTLIFKRLTRFEKMCETEYFGVSDAISIPNSMKIGGIVALNMYFSTHFGCKSRLFSQKFSFVTV
jgi:hypothetical protein